jgi:hypothetical protein
MVSDESDGLVHRQPALARDPLPQRLAGDVGPDAVEEAARVARVVQRQDVGWLSAAAVLISRVKRSGPGAWWMETWPTLVPYGGRDQRGGSLVFGVALSYIWAVIRDHSALASPLRSLPRR